MIIRNAEISDADAFWHMQFELDKETKYMMYEPNERTKDLDRVTRLIKNSVDGSDFYYLQKMKEISLVLSLPREACPTELSIQHI